MFFCFFFSSLTTYSDMQRSCLGTYETDWAPAVVAENVTVQTSHRVIKALYLLTDMCKKSWRPME